MIVLDDIIDGGVDNDRLYGNAGHDLVNCSDGTDYVYGMQAAIPLLVGLEMIVFTAAKVTTVLMATSGQIRFRAKAAMIHCREVILQTRWMAVPE